MKFLIIALSLCLVAVNAQAQEAKKRVQIAGTRVSLIAPEALAPAKNFAGFMEEETNSSVMITEIPVPFSEISAGFTPEGLATRGMILLEKKDILLGSHKGYLLHIRQEAYGSLFLKWLAVTGDEKDTVIITATFPEEQAIRLSAALQQTVLSAIWNANADEVKDPFAGLNFRIRDDSSLKIANKMGNMLLLTPTGTIPDKPSDDPFLIIGPSLSNLQVEPRLMKKIAEQELKKLDKVTEVEIRTSEAVTVNGLPGHEVTALAHDKVLQKPIVVYMTLLFDANTIYLIMGLTKPEAEKQNIELFRKIAGTFILIPK